MKGSAHPFTEANILPKFNEYLSPGKGDINQTRISRLKLLTFSCELDLNRHGWAMRSAHQPAEASICPKYNENPSKGKGDMERT